MKQPITVNMEHQVTTRHAKRISTGGAGVSRQGRVERTSKTRKFVSTVKRPRLEDAKVTYTDEGVRTVKYPKVRTHKTVTWEGRTYRIPKNIAG